MSRALALPSSAKRIAFSASAAAHAAIIAAVLLFADLDRKPPVEIPRSIDLVSVEELLPPAPAPKAAIESPAAPLVAPAQAETKEANPPPQPSQAVPTPGLSAEELGPPAPDGGGMVAAVGEPTAAPSPVPSQPVAPVAAGTGSSAEPDYLPQFRITKVPIIPVKELLAKIEYPPLAAAQGIEATVILELLIDESGRIRKVSVLKDPGFGFAEAAIKALSGLVCEPAQVEGRPVAVRYRYPVRFALK
jgi:protein TonB